MLFDLVQQTTPFSISLFVENPLKTFKQEFLITLSKTFTAPFTKIFKNLRSQTNFFIMSQIAFKIIDLKDVKYELLNALGVFITRVAKESFLIEHRENLRMKEKLPRNAEKSETLEKEEIEMLKWMARARVFVLEIFLCLHIQKDVKLEVLLEMLESIKGNELGGDHKEEYAEMLERLGRKFHEDNAYFGEYQKVLEIIG